tara:strand:+ start:2445 stop:2876 length:432 start_codon:yes stop_codon:yes gene_type:complete
MGLNKTQKRGRKQQKRQRRQQRKSQKGKRQQRKYTKKQQRRQQRKKTSFRKKRLLQKGGFVKPFLPELKNLFRAIPYKASENYHTLHPKPYPAPGNPEKVDINPHPAYDQYLRGQSKMVDPSIVLGPNLKHQFDDSIKWNKNM